MPRRAPSSRTDAARPALERTEAYLCASEFLGQAIPPETLCAYVRNFGRTPSFALLSGVAAMVASRGVKSAKVRALTIGALEQTKTVNPIGISVAEFVRANTGASIAHEQLLLWLQALVLLECPDTTVEPAFEDLAWLMMMANDHLEIDRPSETSTDSLDIALASYAHISRFNAGGDLIADLTRACDLMRTRPQYGPLASVEAWEELQRDAFFGLTFDEYFAEALAPLVIVSSLWGVPVGQSGTDFPCINREQWIAGTNADPKVVASLFDSVTVTVESAIDQLKRERGSRPLPTTPRLFMHKPLVRMNDGMHIAASTRAIAQQARLGLWARCRDAADARHGNLSWHRAFGQSFDLWSRSAARSAATTQAFGATVVARDEIGKGEVSDVVIHSATQDKAVLISAKARVIRADLLDDTVSRDGL